MKQERKTIDSTAIAKLVGVSRSTVSKVINGYPYISEETRDRVNRAIAEYGYYPDHSARIMAGKKTETLGFFFFGKGNFSHDLLVSSIMSAVIESSASVGYHVLSYIIRNADDPSIAKKVKEVFHQRRIDGGIIIGARNHEPLVEELISEGYVVGIFDQNLPGRNEKNRVVANIDDTDTAKRCIEYLYGMGHRDITVINGDIKRFAGEAMRTGFLDVFAALGLAPSEDRVLYSDFTEEGGYASFKKFLEGRGRLPTAVAAANDSVAFGAYRAIKEKGLRIPEDISVIGKDGHPLVSFASPPLTSFEYDYREVMGRLVESTAQVIEAPDAEVERVRYFRSRLVERDSCARISSVGG